MNNDAHEQYQNVTLIDLKLASIYYPILRNLASQKRLLTYGQLIETAKELHPDSPVVQNAIPVGTRRRLEVIRLFAKEQGYPDLTSVIINKGSQECGEWVLKRFDPAKLRKDVFAFDWSKATTEYDFFIAQVTREVTEKEKAKGKLNPKRTTQAQAKILMYEYYKQHRATLPSNIQVKSDLIVKLLMDGATVEDAFIQALSKL